VPSTKYRPTARTAPGSANQNLAVIWYASTDTQFGYQLSATPPWASFSGLTPAAVGLAGGGNYAEKLLDRKNQSRWRRILHEHDFFDTGSPAA